MTHSDYNKKHEYDMDDKNISDYIAKWDETMCFNDDLKKHLKTSWSKDGLDDSSIRKYNLARNKIVSGMTQVFDGLAEMLEVDHNSLVNQDFMNLMGMIAYAKSSAYDKLSHWAKAEREFQQSKGIDLPGSSTRNGKEKLSRPKESEDVWYGLQFMYRQFEVFRYTPNYDIVSGIWNLVANQDRDVVKVLDHWYYIHRDHIESRADLGKVLNGYFFRYNAKMTSEAQAETLFVLNSLFNHTLAKPLGTLECAPWYPDSTISGKEDGDLRHSNSIVPHSVSKKAKKEISKAPLVGKSIDGIRTMPSEPERPKDFQDKELANEIVNKKYKNKKELVEDVKKKERSRKGEKGYFKGRDGTNDQHWDQDDDKSYDNGIDLPDGAWEEEESESESLEEKKLKRGQGFLYVDGKGTIQKIKNGDGKSLKKIVTDRGRTYKIGDTL